MTPDLLGWWVPSSTSTTPALQHCRSLLATYKCPRSVDFVDDLPRDDNGKLYKRLLREQYREGYESLVV